MGDVTAQTRVELETAAADAPAEETHLEILRRGVMAWNQWRDENPDAVPDLEQAKCAHMDLRGVSLRGAKLCGADLTESDLRIGFRCARDVERKSLHFRW